MTENAVLVSQVGQAPVVEHTACLERVDLFNPSVYKQRFVSEHSFAWIDKFRALLVRFDIKKVYFMGSHFLAFALNNFRNSFV